MRVGVLFYSGLIFAFAALSACQKQDQAQTQTPENVAPANTQSLPPALSAEANAKYLAENKAKEGVKTTADGLQYKVVTAGTGDMPTGPADRVQVSYKGSLIDGTVFDQTAPGETVEFAAGGVIHGWVEALSMMKVGDVWELVIPSELGYGQEGAGGGVIPSNQTLVFQVELKGVQHAGENTASGAPAAPTP